MGPTQANSDALYQAALDGLAPLHFEDRGYMDAHIAFRKECTNQGALMLEYLTQIISAQLRTKQGPSHMLSVGSGTGLMDAPLLAAIRQQHEVSYLGIEPNTHEVYMAHTLFTQHCGSTDQINFHNGIIETMPMEPRPDADVAIAVHVTYYSADVKPMISRTLECLQARSGTLYMCVSRTGGPMQLFSDAVARLHGYRPYLSEDVLGLLTELDCDVSTHSLEATIDIARFLNAPDHANTKRFLDFWMHADVGSLSTNMRSMLLDKLTRHSQRSEEGAIRLSHMVEVLEIRHKS